MATSMSNRVSIYATPEVKWYLQNDWLMLNSIIGAAKLPKVLSQMGIKGDTTAFFEKTQNRDKMVCFVHKNYDKMYIRFFKNPTENEVTRCIIPFYKKDYDNSFAVVENENKYTFYHITDEYDIIPRFEQVRSTNGVYCREFTNDSTVKYSFEVDKYLGFKVNMTITIPNSKAAFKQMDELSENIFRILSSGNGKDIYLYYEEVSKILPFNASYHVLCMKTEEQVKNEENAKSKPNENSDDNITDELIIEEGKCKKYKISHDNRSISLFDNHDWYYTQPLISISNEKGKIHFSGHLAEFELDQIEPMKDIVSKIKKFIADNMWFAFEGKIK